MVKAFSCFNFWELSYNQHDSENVVKLRWKAPTSISASCLRTKSFACVAEIQDPGSFSGQLSKLLFGTCSITRIFLSSGQIWCFTFLISIYITMPHNEHHEKLTMDMVHLLNDLPVCSQLLLLFTSSAVPPPTQPGGPDYDALPDSGHPYSVNLWKIQHMHNRMQKELGNGKKGHQFISGRKSNKNETKWSSSSLKKI